MSAPAKRGDAISKKRTIYGPHPEASTIPPTDHDDAEGNREIFLPSRGAVRARHGGPAEPFRKSGQFKVRTGYFPT